MKFYILIILVYMIMLQSCSTILTIGTASLITTSWNDPRTLETQLDDIILEQYISQTLKKNQKIKKPSRIISTVYQGNVLLTGQTNSIESSKEINKIVQNIYGTKKIYNKISQNKPICWKKILIDIWISNQIRLKFLLHNHINISNIKIITENKEVFLLGQVTYEEEKYAIKEAKTINGIKNVFSAFTYITK